MTIVALDVDGTLFDGTGVDPAAVEAVGDAGRAGHTILIVSGRVWSDLPQIIPDVLAHVTAAVCEHGAVLVELATQSTIHLARPIDPALVAAVTATGWRPMVVGDATIGLPAAATESAQAICAGDAGAGYFVESNKDSIAIVPIGCDKGTGLASAVSHLGLDGQQVLAIGDASNDLPMFAAADIAVAVANAEPALVASGIEVAEGAFGAGVAETIRRYVLLAAG